MDLDNLLKQRIAIVGAGNHNRVIAEWLIVQGVRELTICDRNPLVQHNWSTVSPDTVHWRVGSDYAMNLEEFDYVIRTPSIEPDWNPLATARAQGTSIGTWFSLLASLTSGKLLVLAVDPGAQELICTRTTTVLERQFAALKTGQVVSGMWSVEFLNRAIAMVANDWLVIPIVAKDIERPPEHSIDVLVVGHAAVAKESDLARFKLLSHGQLSEQAIIIDFDSDAAIALGLTSVAEDWYISARTPVDRGVYCRSGETEPAIVAHASDGSTVDLFEFTTQPLLVPEELTSVLIASTVGLVFGMSGPYLRALVGQFITKGSHGSRTV